MSETAIRRILVINTAGLGVGGITAHMLNYLKYIAKPEIQIDIAATILWDRQIIEKFKEIGCNIIFMPNRKKHLFAYRKKLKKLIIHKKYDVIHVHGNSATMCIELGLAKHTNIKTRIAHCHNTLCSHKELNKILSRYFKNTYTNALACSEKAGEWIFGKNNFTILKNAIDIDKYKFDLSKREYYRKQYGVDKNTIIIGNVGNMNRQKNQEFLVELLTKLEHCQLWLIGIGENTEMIKTMVKNKNLKNKVQFFGLRDDVEKLMNAMDIFALPSRWEGLPLVLVEAQTNGLPCLVSEYVSEESCINKENYYQIPLEINKWKNLIHPDLLNSDRQSGYIWTENSDYSIQTELKKLKKLYLG